MDTNSLAEEALEHLKEMGEDDSEEEDTPVTQASGESATVNGHVAQANR